MKIQQLLKLISQYLRQILLNKNMKYVFTVILIFSYWLFCVHYNDSYHISISKNIITGETKCDTMGGVKITAPWVQVIKIDTRPVKICIECSCKNINCNLISFNPHGWQDFIQREGFHYYWFSNRFSFNSGNDNEYRGFKNVIRGYAFDNENYSFIKKIDNIQ